MNHLIDVSAVSAAHLHAALLHTLWQGLLLAIVAAIVLRSISARRARTRYAVAVAGLFGVVLAALLTWCTLEYLDAAPAQTMEAMGGAVPPEAAAVQAPMPAAESAPPLPRFPSSPSLADRLLWCWAAGVILMLLRVAWLMRGTRRLRLRCRRLDDPELERLLKEMKKVLRVSRRVTLGIVEEIMSPVAMGLFWPIVLLPAAMATSLPPELLRAVLAHELAHIRRYDYLVNFLQLVVEALLYFNPAVWWLSRQVRLEREASCDALAAQATGSAADYADALAHAARCVQGRGGMALAAQAFGAARDTGRLIERVRRLLLPDYRPGLRLRWHSVAAGGLVTVVLLFGLYQGSVASVALAGWLMSDQERAAIITQIKKEFNTSWEENRAAEEHEFVQVFGAVSTADGQALPVSDRHVHTLSQRGHSSHFESVTFEGNRFQGRLTQGDIYLFFEVPGFAPTCAGPMRGDAQHPIGPLDIRLERSLPARIRFVTAEGRPVSGARVTGGYKFVSNTYSMSINLPSDQDGLIRFEQATKPIPIALHVQAEGFQEADNDRLIVAPGDQFDWILQEDTPIEGVVVDRHSGRPIAGAELALLFEEGRSFRQGTEGKRMAATDAQGRFVLRGLNKQWDCYFLARARGYGTELIAHVTRQQAPLNVSLTPRYVRGVIRGKLALLRHGANGGPVVESSMPLELPEEGHICGEGAHETPVTIEGGEGHFLIDGLRIGTLYVSAGPQTTQVAVSEPVEDLVIDLPEIAARTQRSLSSSLPVPPNATPANGTIIVNLLDGMGGITGASSTLAVTDGHAETRIEVPAKLRLYADGLAGYIASPREEGDMHASGGWEVPEGQEPFQIELPLERAGALHGRVLRADGTPAAGASVNLSSLEGGKPNWPFAYFSSAYSNFTCNEQGEFAASPLPLDRKYKLEASIDLCRAEETIQLASGNPIVQLQLRLPPGVDVPVRVVQPDGQPLSNIEVTAICPDGPRYQLKTDSAGVCLLRGIDPGREYWLRADPLQHFQHNTLQVDPNASENLLRLEEGLLAEGTLLRAGTEDPVSGLKLIARRIGPAPANQPFDYVVTAVSDGEGRFRFSDLCPGDFSLSLDSRAQGVLEPPEGTRVFRAGQAEPVVVHLKADRAAEP